MEAALARQGQHLTEYFQSCGAHRIAGELDQIRGSRIAAHDEALLAEDVEDGTAALDVGRGATRNDEELTGLCGIRIPEYGCRDVTLAGLEVFGGELGRGRGADGAHRKMDRARRKAES